MTTASRLGEGAALPGRDLWLIRVGPLDLGVRIVGTQPEYKWAVVSVTRTSPQLRLVRSH